MGYFLLSDGLLSVGREGVKSWTGIITPQDTVEEMQTSFRVPSEDDFDGVIKIFSPWRPVGRLQRTERRNVDLVVAISQTAGKMQERAADCPVTTAIIISCGDNTHTLV